MIYLFLVLSIFLFVTLAVIGIGHHAFAITPQPNEEPEQLAGRGFRDVFFPNNNQEALHGWWIPDPKATLTDPKPTLVLIHGWGRNAGRMLPYYQVLKDHSLNFLLLDGRGHGDNAPNNFISQLGFSRDITAALDWLVLQPGVDVRRMGVIGHSLGAAAALFAASIDKRISLLVADSSYADPLSVIKRMLKARNIPYLPLGWLIKHYIQARLRMTMDRISPLNAVRNIQNPTLLIHGTDDTTTPFDDSRKLHSAAGDNHFRFLPVSGSNHSDTIHHPEVRSAIRAFITDHWISSSNNHSETFNPYLSDSDII